MKKKLNLFQFVFCFILIFVLLHAFGIIVFEEHKHDWRDATCTQPRTCRNCGETDGDPLGHDWQEATCLSRETCKICGATRGTKAEHIFVAATCTEPQTCSVCGKTIGNSLGHCLIHPTFDTPSVCSRCGEEYGDPLPPDTFSRGKYSRWIKPDPSTIVGVFGYVAVSYNSYSYNLSDDPYENDWFITPWKASIYERDKQFWNVIGTVDHKTAVKVIDQKLTDYSHVSGSFDGYLFVEDISNGNQFYISVTDFVTIPYWESDDIASILYSGPVLAEYHQVSDFYPVDSSGRRFYLEDGEIVLVRGSSFGSMHVDAESNQIDALSQSGRCYFNASDLTVIY